MNSKEYIDYEMVDESPKTPKKRTSKKIAIVENEVINTPLDTDNSPEQGISIIDPNSDTSVKITEEQMEELLKREMLRPRRYVRKLDPSIDVPSEYVLVMQKQSKLSAWERNEIIRLHSLNQ